MPTLKKNAYSTGSGRFIAAFVLGFFLLPPSLAADATANVVASAETPLQELIAEALRNNPEIRAARHEAGAAHHRISPAGALDDPLLEAGVVNLPLSSLSFKRDDMTMKMLGLSQKLPFPGKRALREEIAAKDTEALDHAYRETANRVVRDLKLAYFDLALVIQSTRMTQKNAQILGQFLKIAETRYTTGQGNQADVLKAQIQLSRMRDELIRLSHERQMIEADLGRAAGRGPGRAIGSGELLPEIPRLHEAEMPLETLRETALKQRPQLLALQNLVERNARAVDLARQDYYPDFDVKLSYGQRSGSMDGVRRDDMVSLTLAMNLPLWRASKLEPRVAEAIAMRDQMSDMYQAQQNEVFAKLRQQAANARHSLQSARLYESTILPQARLGVETALVAYRVNRVDFMTLLDSQMTVFNYEIAYETALANYNKALAEIDLLTGAQQRIVEEKE